MGALIWNGWVAVGFQVLRFSGFSGLEDMHSAVILVSPVRYPGFWFSDSGFLRFSSRFSGSVTRFSVQ